MATTVSYDLDEIAMVAHQVNKAYCESIGDMSQVDWEDVPDWQHASAICGVEHAINSPDATPEDQHAAWLQHKEKEGWKYGPVKDADKKEHPCFVPYDQLPEAQRVKDRLFLAVCRAMSVC